MYRVIFASPAKKELEALPRADGDRLTVAAHGLADDPRPPGCMKISGARFDLYRLRVGRYRIIYEVRDDVLLVLVVRVAKRDERTYRSL